MHGLGTDEQECRHHTACGASVHPRHVLAPWRARFSRSPCEKFLFSGSGDGTVRLWSMEMQSNLVAYSGHNHPVWDVSVCPRGFYFASASFDRTARVWTMDSAHARRIMVGHLGDVECVRWHPNCNYIATGSSDKTARLWVRAPASFGRIAKV